MAVVADACAYPSFAAAVLAVSTTGGLLHVTTDQAVTANLTIPENVAVEVSYLAKITGVPGVTLCVNGPFQAQPGKVFEGFDSKAVRFKQTSMVFPEWWGTGFDNDQIALNEAINASNLICLTGNYRVSGTVLIPYGGYRGARKVFKGLHRRAVIGAVVPNIIVLQVADCFSEIRNLELWGNNSGETLLAVIPEGGAANTTVTNQNYNIIDNVYFSAAPDALVLMAGKAIGGQASGCWYNKFTNLHFAGVKRCIWLKDSGSTDIVTSGSNSNIFEGIMNGSINTGIQIDAGGGNLFRMSAENITLGTAPNAVPTTAIVRRAMLNSRINQNNVFHDYHIENATRHLLVDEPSTMFFNSDLDQSLIVGAAAGVFLDDGKSRVISTPLLPDTGSIGLDLSLSKVSWSENDGVVNLRGYLHVSAIASPTGRLRLRNLPKPSLPGTQSRSTGVAIINGIPPGAGFSSGVCRMIEGTDVLEFFGVQDGHMVDIAGVTIPGFNITFSITYPV